MRIRNKDEWIAFDAFRHALSCTFGLTVESFQHYQNPQDPPDFRFVVEGVEYGAEVTQICDSTVDQYPKSRAFLNKLTQRIKERGLTLGAWRCAIRGGPAIPNPSCKEGIAQIDRISDALGEARHAPEQSEFRFNDSEEGEIVFTRIQQQSEFGTFINLMTFSEFEAKTRETVTKLIRDASSKKLDCLQRKGFPSSQCVLLLLDSYPLSETREVEIDTEDLQEFRAYHSVAWIPAFNPRVNLLKPELPGRFCHFLWKSKKRWNRD